MQDRTNNPNADERREAKPGDTSHMAQSQHPTRQKTSSSRTPKDEDTSTGEQEHGSHMDTSDTYAHTRQSH